MLLWVCCRHCQHFPFALFWCAPARFWVGSRPVLQPRLGLLARWACAGVMVTQKHALEKQACSEDRVNSGLALKCSWALKEWAEYRHRVGLLGTCCATCILYIRLQSAMSAGIAGTSLSKCCGETSQMYRWSECSPVQGRLTTMTPSANSSLFCLPWHYLYYCFKLPCAHLSKGGKKATLRT